MFENTLGTVEIAKLIGMSRITVHSWIVKGALKATRTPGRHFRVTPDDLIDFLNGRDVPIPDKLRAMTATLRCALIGRQTDLLRRIKRDLETGGGNGARPIGADVFANPLPALIAIGARPPAIVAMDVVLPQVSAIELIRAIRERIPETRIAGLEREENPEARRGLLQAGANIVIPSPVYPDEAAGRLRELV